MHEPTTDRSASTRAPDPVERYPAMHSRPQRFRTRWANGIAALALLGAIVLVVLVLAVA